MGATRTGIDVSTKEKKLSIPVPAKELISKFYEFSIFDSQGAVIDDVKKEFDQALKLNFIKVN